jgi:hypothetical protein
MEVRGNRVKAVEDPRGGFYEGTMPFGRGVGSNMVQAMGQVDFSVADQCILLSDGGSAQTERERAWEGIYIGMGAGTLFQVISLFVPRAKKPDPSKRIVRRRPGNQGSEAAS